MPPGLGFSLVAAVRDFDPEKRFESRIHQTLDRNAQFALAAAGEAIRDAGIEFTPGRALRTGVITGCGIGGSGTLDVSYERLHRQGKTRASSMTVPNLMPSAGAGHISMKFGLKGPSFTVSSACASSAHAMGAAGAVEAVASVLALDRQTVPVHPDGFVPDPAIGAGFSDRKPGNETLRGALSHSFAFGGLNAVLAFRREPREF